jgi:hypothetical protein
MRLQLRAIKDGKSTKPMRLFNVWLWQNETKVPLGRVKAQSVPGAKLRAFKKYRSQVPNEKQRRVGADPVVPFPKVEVEVEPVPENVKRFLRVLNKAMSDSLI